MATKGRERARKKERWFGWESESGVPSMHIEQRSNHSATRLFAALDASFLKPLLQSLLFFSLVMHQNSFCVVI